MKCKIEGIKISAISATLPANVVEVASFGENFGGKKIQQTIKLTGIERLHIAGINQTTSDLAKVAAEHLFSKLEFDNQNIDALVFVSQTPDYIMPATSCILQEKLNLRNDITTWDINYGCSGYIYGLLEASILIKSGVANNVLLLVGDVLTKHLSPKDRNVRVVFGDASTASIISRGNDVLKFVMQTDGSGANKLIIPAGGEREPFDESNLELIHYGDGESRSPRHLFMDGLAIYNFTLDRVPKLIDDILGYAEWEKNDVGSFIFHQANAFMLEYLCKKLRIPLNQAPIDVVDTGNTGPASIPLLLCRKGDSLKKSNNTALNKVVLAGFGVGLSWGAVTCDLSETIFLPPIHV